MCFYHCTYMRGGLMHEISLYRISSQKCVMYFRTVMYDHVWSHVCDQYCSCPRLNLKPTKWWGSSVESHCWMYIFHISQVCVCSAYRGLSHRIMSTYLCELSLVYCSTLLPARPHHEATVRHLYSVTLHLRINALGMCTWYPSMKRSMSKCSQSCEHHKGQLLVVTYSYHTLTI